MALEKETAESLGLKLAVHTPISVQAAMSNHVDDSGGQEDDKKPDEEEDDETEEQE